MTLIPRLWVTFAVAAMYLRAAAANAQTLCAKALPPRRPPHAPATPPAPKGPEHSVFGRIVSLKGGGRPPLSAEHQTHVVASAGTPLISVVTPVSEGERIIVGAVRSNGSARGLIVRAAKGSAQVLLGAFSLLPFSLLRGRELTVEPLSSAARGLVSLADLLGHVYQAHERVD